MDEDNTTRNMICGIGVILLLVVVSIQNIPYGGGWEATSYFSELTVDGTTVELGARSKYTYDVDGNAPAGTEPLVFESDYDKPGISVEMAGPYYLQLTGVGWKWSADPIIIETYDRDYGNGSFIRYDYYTIGYDVTIKTDADEYYYPGGAPLYLNYGWYFEDERVVVSILSTFSITPWTPVGPEGNWTRVGGWSGVMKAVCVGVEHGLVGEGVVNYGYTIQNLDSENSNLNMYTEDGYFGGANWGDDVALAGVPHTVDVEHGAKLGAGAEYTSQWPLVDKWLSCTARNVYVKYTIKIDVLTSVRWAPALGVQLPLVKPEENKTDDAPNPAPWDDFLQQLGDAFMEWGVVAQQYALYIIIIAGFLVGLKFYWSRQDDN